MQNQATQQTLDTLANAEAPEAMQRLDAMQRVMCMTPKEAKDALKRDLAEAALVAGGRERISRLSRLLAAW